MRYLRQEAPAYSFVDKYRSLIGAVLQDHYTYRDYLEGGQSLLEKDPFLATLHGMTRTKDIQEALKARTGKKAAEALKESSEKLEKMIRKAVKNDKLSVKLENLRDKKTASMLTVNEQSRRMADMMKMYAASGMPMGLDEFAKEGQTLVLNAKHPLVKYIMEHEEDKLTKLIGRQLYDLAQIQNAPLSPDDMAGFVVRSNEIMMMLMNKEDGSEEKAEENTEEKSEDSSEE